MDKISYSKLGELLDYIDGLGKLSVDDWVDICEACAVFEIDLRQTFPERAKAMKHEETTLWLMLFKCPRTGSIYGRASMHNCTADYKNSPNFIGSQEIYVDLKEMKNVRRHA